MDQQTVDDDIEWSSYLVAFGDNQFDEHDEMRFFRTDFYLSMVLLGSAELGCFDLDEGTHVPNLVLRVDNMSNY